MAKIPSVADMGLGGGPSPASGAAGYRGEMPGADAIPAALAAAAQDFTQAGNLQFGMYKQEQGRIESERARQQAELDQRFKEEKRKADAARAEDAFNQLRHKTLEFTVGEGGFTRLQGAQVATNPKLLQEYTAKATDAARLLAEGLDNEDQRQAFKVRADLGLYQYQHDLLTHISRERVAFGKELYKGTVETEITQATAHYTDPVAVATSVERITAATNDMADAQGLPKTGPGSEARTAAITENVGKVHQSVISQAIADNKYGYAKEWFERYGTLLPPNVQAQTRHLLLDGEQKEAYNVYAQRFNGARRDLKALRALDADVAADKTLDETRKTALQGRIESATAALENKAAMEAERAERRIQAQITAVNSQTLMGYPPTAAQLAPLINSAKGTSLEPLVRQMVATANETERFQRLPPQAQEAYINRLESLARTDPTKFDIQVLARFKAIQQAQQQAVREDPVGFMVRQNFIDPQSPGAQPLDFSKPDAPEFAQQLAARFDLARQVGQRYQTGVKPLQPAEAQVLASATRDMQPEAKRDYFSRLAKAAGTDTSGYRAMMQQIAPDDVVTAAGGIAAMRGLKTADGKFVADSIFRGQSYLQPPRDKDGKQPKSQVVMPSGQEKERMDQEFDNITGNAFEGQPEPRQIFLETARAIYADKIAQASNHSGNMDKRAWRAAVTEALGAEPLQWNGKTVIPPANMKAGEFKDALRLRIDDLAARGRLPEQVTARTLWNVPLINIGDGKYSFSAGGQRVVGADGKPIVLDFNQPWVPLPRAPGSPPTVVDIDQWRASTGGVLKPGQTQAEAVAEWKRGRK